VGKRSEDIENLAQLSQRTLSRSNARCERFFNSRDTLRVSIARFTLRDKMTRSRVTPSSRECSLQVPRDYPAYNYENYAGVIKRYGRVISTRRNPPAGGRKPSKICIASVSFHESSESEAYCCNVFSATSWSRRAPVWITSDMSINAGPINLPFPTPALAMYPIEGD